MQTITFGDYDYQPLNWSFVSARPYHRCLYFQWMMVLQQATIDGVPVDEEFVNEIGDFCSDGVEFKEQDVVSWLRSVE